MPALHERLGAVIAGGRYVLGPELDAFEREFADHLGAEHCIGVANGTDALDARAEAPWLLPGDEVVTAALVTCHGHRRGSVTRARAPIFADVDPGTPTASPRRPSRARSPRAPGRSSSSTCTAGWHIAPVPEGCGRFGPARSSRTPAQAAGAVALTGTIGGRARRRGHVLCSSPSKNLFCLGDGGAVTTNDAEVAARVKRLRFHGFEDKQTFVDVGFNSRLDELQAAALASVPAELDRADRGAPAGGQGLRRTRGWRSVATARPVDGADQVYHLYAGQALIGPRSCSRSRRRGGRGSSPTTASRCTSSPP